MLASSTVHQHFLLAFFQRQPLRVFCYVHTSCPAHHYKLAKDFLVKGHPCFAAQTCTISMHVTEAIHQNVVPAILSS